MNNSWPVRAIFATLVVSCFLSGGFMSAADNELSERVVRPKSLPPPTATGNRVSATLPEETQDLLEKKPYTIAQAEDPPTPTPTCPCNCYVNCPCIEETDFEISVEPGTIYLAPQCSGSPESLTPEGWAGYFGLEVGMATSPFSKVGTANECQGTCTYGDKIYPDFEYFWTGDDIDLMEPGTYILTARAYTAATVCTGSVLFAEASCIIIVSFDNEPVIAPGPDSDRDGLADFIELNITYSDEDLADSNEDGVFDSVAYRTGGTPSDDDFDNDSVDGVNENARGTTPFHQDSDRDGVSDYSDGFPLDPTRTTAPSSDPGDVTHPSIVITSPRFATY